MPIRWRIQLGGPVCARGLYGQEFLLDVAIAVLQSMEPKLLQEKSQAICLRILRELEYNFDADVLLHLAIEISSERI